jgi:hypothetical protein
MQSHTHSYTKPESTSNLAANGNYYGQYNIYSRNTGSVTPLMVNEKALSTLSKYFDYIFATLEHKSKTAS